MAFVTKDLLLSGHNLLDYQHMFDLTQADLDKKIITLASGFDSFNAQMHAMDKHVVSCARNYHLSVENMSDLVLENLTRLQEHVESNLDDFLLADSKDLNEVEKKWVQSAKLFLKDYPQGLEYGRYRADVLPNLHFEDFQFDIALSSHFLFAQNDLTLDNHVDFIKEMGRVAKEVRIFPLNNLEGEISPLLGPVMLALQNSHFEVEVRQVNYEFQRGGNAMLRAFVSAVPIPANDVTTK